MKKEIIDLAEAVRALDMKLSPTLENNKNVKLCSNKRDYAFKFYNLYVALEEFDKINNNGLQNIDDPSIDSAKLRLSLDGVFKWMRLVGIDIAEPHAIVSDILGVKNKQEKSFRPVPKYAISALKKKEKEKLMLSFNPGPGEKINLESIRQKVYQSMNVLEKMGPAGAR